MRILLLCHAFNSLSQRLWTELTQRGHELSVEYDIADAVSEEAAALFQPHLIIAPYLRRAIPVSLWSRLTCLIVHPGPPGDRGPAALDHAILRGEQRWGVTVLQAEAEMDAGPVWASAEFPMRAARKSSLYRREVADAAVAAVLQAVERFAAGGFAPQRPAHSYWRPALSQAERRIDWARDDSERVLRKIRAADGFPGVADDMGGLACRIFDAAPETLIADATAAPGAVIARRQTALLRRTVDGAVWIGQVRVDGGVKLPAALALPAVAAAAPEAPPPAPGQTATWRDISWREQGEVGFLAFDFYNGAMSEEQCLRLREALAQAKQRPVKVLVLQGGGDFWSNGIHLNVIEAAALADESPADESWRNIEAINDLALELINTPRQLTIAAVAGDAGAGGCYLARAADLMWLRDGVILNPHYHNMGNLHGSEYWTYLLPRRVGAAAAQRIINDRLPLAAAAAVGAGFADELIAAGDDFAAAVANRAAALAASADFAAQLAEKNRRRAADEAQKPLAVWRAEEMAQMQRNFYGFDPGYHIARHHFVHKSPASWTPRHLARHRDLDWTPPS